MARYISFAVLLAIIVVIGALFYKVMIGFFVPVFLAAVLVVVFRPLHRWVCSKVGDRDHIAASITTTLILLIVLIPAGLVLTMAAIQGAGFAKDFNLSSIQYGLAKLRSNDWINLEYPHAAIVRDIQTKVDDIQTQVTGQRSFDELLDPKGVLVGDVKEIRRRMEDLIPSLEKSSHRDLERMITKLRGKPEPAGSSLHLQIEELFKDTKLEFDAILPLQRESMRADLSPTDRESTELIKKQFADKLAKVKSQPSEKFSPASDAERDLAESARRRFLEQALEWQSAIDSTNLALDDVVGPASGSPFSSSLSRELPSDIVELQKQVFQLGQQWAQARNTFSGGAWLGFARDLANPSPEQVQGLTQSFFEYIRPRLLSFGGDSAAFLLRLVIGASILLLSLYFFLCDGPAMVRSIMELSPLDDRYELELLAEFDRISRAIVLATVLSALLQGVTAGIGYYFVGMPSLVLLIALTCTCALIPFVGPAIVWVPVCLYLAIYQENLTAAVGLAVWGMLVVASIDNVVKMLVLHGQSQLHPLLALLSVLGGIQALGPIGILIGPMVVVLLQTLLGILRHELTKFKKSEEGEESASHEAEELSGMIRKAKVTIQETLDAPPTDPKAGPGDPVATPAT